MTAVHIPTNQRCDMVDARISSGRVSWESGPKNVVQIIFCGQPNQANPPGVSDASAPKGNRGALGLPTVAFIRRISALFFPYRTPEALRIVLRYTLDLSRPCSESDCHEHIGMVKIASPWRSSGPTGKVGFAALAHVQGFLKRYLRACHGEASCIVAF